MSAKLRLVVRDCGRRSAGRRQRCEPQALVVYAGPLASFRLPAGLGLSASGERRQYEFRATLARSAGNAYQGGRTRAVFEWRGIRP